MAPGWLGVHAPPPDGARLECGVCWAVYDPRVGDPSREIPPGTPFAALPVDWSCPSCDAARERFLLADDDGG
jgi:rubredoxin